MWRTWALALLAVAVGTALAALIPHVAFKPEGIGTLAPITTPWRR